MNLNKNWLPRKRGIIATFLLSVYGLFILYKNGIPGVSFTEDKYILFGISEISATDAHFIFFLSLLFLTFSFFRQVSSKEISDLQKYVQPAFTTIETIIGNKDLYGVQTAFIGSESALLRTSEFVGVYEDYKKLRKSSFYYDKVIDYNRRLTKWNPNAKHLVVKYQDGRYQFSELGTVSNERNLAVQFLKTLTEEGVPVEGEYESLKDAPEQFSPKIWSRIFIMIFIGTIIFIVMSVIAVGIIDGNI